MKTGKSFQKKFKLIIDEIHHRSPELLPEDQGFCAVYLLMVTENFGAGQYLLLHLANQLPVPILRSILDVAATIFAGNLNGARALADETLFLLRELVTGQNDDFPASPVSV